MRIRTTLRGRESASEGSRFFFARFFGQFRGRRFSLSRTETANEGVGCADVGRRGGKRQPSVGGTDAIEDREPG